MSRSLLQKLASLSGNPGRCQESTHFVRCFYVAIAPGRSLLQKLLNNNWLVHMREQTLHVERRFSDVDC